MALGALGVVFGDIGTSPLYALQTVFSADHQAVKATESDVFGVISLVFWSITLIVSVEFVLFIMRADNEGEGGILALIAKVMETRLREAPYLAGDDYSIADIACYAWTLAATTFLKDALGAELDGKDCIRGWLDRVGGRPAVQRGMAVPKT